MAVTIQRGVVIDEILVLPRPGYQAGDEVGQAKELLRDAGIMVIQYECVETHALLSLRALDSGMGHRCADQERTECKPAELTPWSGDRSRRPYRKRVRKFVERHERTMRRCLLWNQRPRQP